MVILGGCVHTPEKPPLVLPWPSPLAPCEVTDIEVLPGTTKIVMSYQDNISIALCDRDMFRYIKDLTNMVCIHQPTDKRCK